MKALKRKEVEEKLLKLVEAAGEGAEGLGGMDLETDWDPVEHDRKMAEVYGGDYGGVQVWDLVWARHDGTDVCGLGRPI